MSSVAVNAPSGSPSTVVAPPVPEYVTVLVSVLAVRPTAAAVVISSCVGVDGSTAALSTPIVCPPLTTVSPDTAGSGNEAIGSDSVTTTVELARHRRGRHRRARG